MRELIATDDYLPIPFPNEDVQKVRDWLERVIPLSACEKYVETINDVFFDSGADAPHWIKELAKKVAAHPPRPIDIQVLCYTAMIQQPIHKAVERIFEMSFDTPDVWRDAPPRFRRFVATFYRWRLEALAEDCQDFQKDPVAGRVAISRVWFEVVTDAVLFKQERPK